MSITCCYIKEQYFLEVSSPGIERVLRKDKHLEQNIGKDINVKLFKKDENGAKEYLGTLKEFNQNEIIIETEEQEIKIERKNKMYLSNNEIKTLEKYNVNYNNYDSLSSLIFDLNEIEGDDDLEQLAIELSEFNYYNNQNK